MPVRQDPLKMLLPSLARRMATPNDTIHHESHRRERIHRPSLVAAGMRTPQPNAADISFSVKDFLCLSVTDAGVQIPT